MTARRWAMSGAAGLLVLLAGAWGARAAMKARCWAFGAPVVCHVAVRDRVVALSFDDGPTRIGTDAVLPVLAAHGAHATFFLIGAEVARDPADVRRIVAAGHEVGNHSFAHGRMISPFAARYRDEIARTDAAVMAAGAPRPTLFRPPYGAKFTGLARAVAGKTIAMWDFEEPVARPGGARAYADAVLRSVRPGSIILIHPMYASRSVERAALPMILDGLRARGYRVVTVSELIAAGSAPGVT
ncbi:polysaccharide deacetylase family protein [Sphingomonas sp.]|uniref:polysaccharide deacetylase family protein n=1 Tax=Sphingomonas sp. TaxID=28214 RepID=UPI001EBACC06|nr:polysaccharide deacetylase family protein [Sphingomonas sp.]MBX3595431.1 polysaccharide deacetylase family protein [Sphingomonas sp.]